MQLDKRKTSTVNQLLGLEAIREERGPRGGRPAPANKSISSGHPLPTSTASHTPLSVLDGRSGFAQRERGATDTPLSMYAMHRARYKMSVLSSILTPREIPQTVQVPLSALCSAKAKPGAVGGSFNSTSKMKCIPLPSIYDHHQVTRRGIRNITLHSERYTPSFRSSGRSRTISDSLLHLAEPRRQKEHLLEREMDVQRSRSFKKSREEIPHRLERAFYMNGHSAQFFNRQDLTPEELSTLQAISLSQNRELYYGRGMRSARRGQGGPVKAVQRFQTQLREAVEDRDREFDDFSIDIETVHRVSRTVTPATVAVPEEGVIEEEEEEMAGERRNSKETFITESGVDVDNGVEKERTGC